MRLSTLALVFLSIWALPEAARAEPAANVFIGAAITQDDDVTLRIGPAGGLPQTSLRVPTEYKTVATGGLRGTYWIDRFPYVGLALDIQGYEPDQDEPGPSVNLDVFPISALVLFRVPLLESSNFPHGRLQPYAGVGPGVFISTAKFNLSSLGAPEDFEDTNINIGVNVAAGVKFHLFSFAKRERKERNKVLSVAAFVEYGFNHFKPSKWGDDIQGVPFEIEIDRLDTHRVVVGAAFHFW